MATYPKEVSILEASGIVKGRFHSSDDKQHCTIGWIQEQFNNDEAHENRIAAHAYDILMESDDPQKNVAKRHFEKNKWAGMSATSRHRAKRNAMIEWNDSRKTTKSRIARLFNALLAKLGYDVPKKEFEGFKV